MKKYIKYIIIIIVTLILNTFIIFNSFKITNIEKTQSRELIRAEILGIGINYYYEY